MKVAFEQFLQLAKNFFGNYLIVSAMTGWVSAQILKIFTDLYQHRRIKLSKILFSSGGMPSSHSASIVALAFAAAIQEGVASSIFAVAGVFSIIVMMDAAGVRYETGKHSAFLNKLAQEISKGDPDAVNVCFKELVGHTPLQVFFGALLGVGVAIGLSFAFGVEWKLIGP